MLNFNNLILILKYSSLNTLVSKDIYCGGVRWPAPEKSPDLGNSSPTPKVLMYIKLATDLRSRQARKYGQTERTGVTRPKLGGYG
jgi:hypothetical protein